MSLPLPTTFQNQDMWQYTSTCFQKQTVQSHTFLVQIIRIYIITECEELFQIPITIEFSKPKSTTSYSKIVQIPLINDNNDDILK